jgi:hypothetical protein
MLEATIELPFISVVLQLAHILRAILVQRFVCQLHTSLHTSLLYTLVEVGLSLQRAHSHIRCPHIALRVCEHILVATTLVSHEVLVVMLCAARGVVRW